MGRARKLRGSMGVALVWALIFVVGPAKADAQVQAEAGTAMEEGQGGQAEGALDEVIAGDGGTVGSPAAPADPDDQRARELYYRGDRLYAEGDYEGAVVTFEEAYRLSERPALLFNLANALERLGRHEEALHRLAEYEPYAPGYQREVLQKRLTALAERVEAKRKREAAEAPPPPVATPAQVAVAAEPPAVAGPTRERVEVDSGVPVLGYSLLGVGVAAVGVGVVFALAAGADRDDAESRCAEGPKGTLCLSTAAESVDGEAENALVADIAVGAGIVALVAGTLLVLDLDFDDDESDVEVSVHAGPVGDGGRVSLVGRY